MPATSQKLGASQTKAQSRARKYKPQPAGRFSRDNLGALEPASLASIIKSAQTGDLERWADLCAYMLRTDPHVRSVLMTRIQAVAGADVDVISARPGDNQVINDDAVEAVREMFSHIDNLEDRLGDLLYGMAMGLAVLEVEWVPDGRDVWPRLHFVHPRDLRFNADWDVLVRTYTNGVAHWINTADHPLCFIVHKPHNFAERPTLTGELMAVAWPWLFKRWIEKDGLNGYGRMANGMMIGRVSPNATPAVRDAMQTGLEDIAANGVAVFEADPAVGTPVELLEMARDPGSAAKALLDHYNGEISKAILGSGLNVEVGSTGGNRALGESQFDTTTLPRLVADAARVAATLRRQLVRPFLRYNVHRFGGSTPDAPDVVLRVVAEDVDTVVIDQLIVGAGAVTVDELRKSRGLEPLGADRGGDRLITPIAKSPMDPGFKAPSSPTSGLSVEIDDGPSVSGGAPARPLASSRPKRRPTQLSMDFTPTRSASRPTPLGLALSRRSDDPER